LNNLLSREANFNRGRDSYTDEELDFINYDIKYHMGREAEGDGE
jgi:hypothetical protein